jgi:hypothetical protein
MFINLIVTNKEIWKDMIGKQKANQPMLNLQNFTATACLP